MFIAFLSVFVTTLVVIVSLLWLLRMIRIWNGEINASDLMAWSFLMVPVLGITASVFLVRMTLSVLAGV